MASGLALGGHAPELLVLHVLLVLVLLVVALLRAVRAVCAGDRVARPCVRRV